MAAPRGWVYLTGLLLHLLSLGLNWRAGGFCVDTLLIHAQWCSSAVCTSRIELKRTARLLFTTQVVRPWGICKTLTSASAPLDHIAFLLSPCGIQLCGELLHSSLSGPVNLYGWEKKRALHWRVLVNNLNLSILAQPIQAVTRKTECKYSATMWAGCVLCVTCLHVHTLIYAIITPDLLSVGASLSIGSLFCQYVWTMFLSPGLSSYSASIPAFLSLKWAWTDWHTHTHRGSDTQG